jgi:hypothetical protein
MALGKQNFENEVDKGVDQDAERLDWFREAVQEVGTITCEKAKLYNPKTAQIRP